MALLTRSLDDIGTSFTVFEKNQVLTHEQLNALTAYLDDQERLTRVAALGVGVICGLRPSLGDGTVRVSRGVGITTDGDLLRFPEDVDFDRFKPYSESAPTYPMFKVEEQRIPLFELVQVGAEDAAATALSALSAAAGAPLGNLVALLLMETYEQDPDLCTGADCDNLGKNSLHTPRVLLVHPRHAAQLRPRFDTPDAAARELDEIAATRPLLRPDVDTPSEIGAAYVTACAATLTPLKGALDKIYPRCGELLRNVFASDPAPVWRGVLDGLQAKFTATTRGLQYFHDFLVDLVETYRAFRNVLFGDTSICVPDVAGFPKHLLLGTATRAVGPTPFRTGFFPSPAVSGCLKQRDHARFLARKLDAMVLTFEVPEQTIALRVTPSHLEDRPLEDRAIPHYYKYSETMPVHRAWSHRLERQGRSATNYGYAAAAYGATGAAADPLAAPIEAFTLFRIEGHLGRDAQEALSLVTREIQDRNLPFTARTVLLDGDRTKLPWQISIRRTDLHHLHHLLRNDLAIQLEDVKTSSGKLKDDVKTAVISKTIVDETQPTEGLSLADRAEESHRVLGETVDKVASKLKLPLSAVRSDVQLKKDLGSTLELAGRFKSSLGSVVQTAFSSPFDGLITSTHVNWLPWVEGLIGQHEDKEKDKVLFGQFLREHPGLAHRAGVPAGGTFVLAYDTSGKVVADFALPYFAPAPPEEVEDEPPLPRPIDVRPPFIIERPIQVLPSRDKAIRDKLSEFRAKLEPDLLRVADSQKKYLDGLKDTLALFGGSKPTSTPGSGGTGGTPGTPSVTTAGLGDLIGRVNDARVVVEDRRNALINPGLSDADKTAATNALKDAEASLATSISDTARFVATSGIEVTPGTDGHVAMTTVSSAMTLITSHDAANEVKEGLNTSTSNVVTRTLMRSISDSLMRH